MHSYLVASLTQWVLDQANHFGYLAVFIGVGIEYMGIPVPGETTLLLGVILATQGHLAVWGVALAGLVAAFAGANAGYFLGRRFGDRLFHAPVLRRIYTPPRIARAERFIARRGVYAVIFGRFVALLRIFAGPLAGMHRMQWRSFLAANAIGATVWVALVTLVGILVGGDANSALALLARIAYAGLALLIVGSLVSYLVFRKADQ